MKLGYMMLLVAVGAMLVAAPVAMAAKGGGGDKGHAKGTYGKVTAVEGTVATIELMAKKDAPAADKKVVKTDDKTTFFKGEKGAETEAKIADVTVGAHVMVTIESEKVTKVVIMPAGEHKKK